MLFQEILMEGVPDQQQKCHLANEDISDESHLHLQDVTQKV